MKTKKIFLLCCIIFTTACTYAQSIGPSIFNNAGGSAVVAGYTCEWSVGEMPVIKTYSSSTLVVTQGLLQPFDATTSIKNTYLISNLSVFPTPVDNTLYLQPSFTSGGALQYSLQDIAGHTLATNEIKLTTGNEKQSLDMSAYAAGVYVLKVVFIQGDKTYTAPYKIQKNH